MIEDRPAEELERLAPGVDEFGKAVAVGVLHFAFGEVILVEHRAPRPLPFDQDGVEHLGPGGVVRVVQMKGRREPGGAPFRLLVDQVIPVVVDGVIAGLQHADVLVDAGGDRVRRTVDPRPHEAQAGERRRCRRPRHPRPGC